MDNSLTNVSDSLNLLNKSKSLKCVNVKNAPKRYVLAIFAFFGFFFAYILRANLSVAIVQMSRQIDEVGGSIRIENLTISNHQTPLKWSTSLQGYILSSFFYGYIFTQLPGGFLSNKYGGKLFFGLGIGLCSLFSLFIPLAAKNGAGYVIFLRILQGLSQGFIYPSMHALWSKWSPPFERSRLTTFALSGSYIGTVVAMSVGGIIGKEINWESIFYIFGAFGLVWTILWFYYIHESPNHHTSILLDEKTFIESSITHQASLSIPWMKICKSKVVWAIIAAHCAENWGFYTLLTELPTFMADILNYNVDKAGLVSSLPYLSMAIALYTSGYFSDYLIEKKSIECTIVRKLFCCFGLVAQGFFMFLITTITNPSVIIVLVTFAVGFGGMAWASFGVNQLDIGSGYANIVMSISNFFATIPGIFSPILAGYLIESKEKSDWNKVFYISSVIFFIGAIAYAFFGSGELQTWASEASNYNNLNQNKKDKSHLSGENEIKEK